jgi:hypothetical protein
VTDTRLDDLAHDVGKYVARTARNLPPAGPIPAMLFDMLVRDLYALDGARRASEVLAAMRQGLGPNESIDRAAGALARIDALEPRVRAGDDDAARAAAALAIDVSTALREAAR